MSENRVQSTENSADAVRADQRVRPNQNLPSAICHLPSVENSIPVPDSTELVAKPASELSALLENREISSHELVEQHLARIESVDPEVGAYLRTCETAAYQAADAVDQARSKGETVSKVAGIPIALKDIVVTRGIETTNASKILQGWIPPYDATIVEWIKQAGLPILGKTNMDEFAMGSSTETSAFQITKNPRDLERIPGGSSGGSAAAIAGNMATWAIGTDTGGSIRQPAAVTGTVGFKPTYGVVSRYGLIAMASSLDQAGPMARGVMDTALLQEVIQGYDYRDSTSIPEFFPEVVQAAQKGQTQDLAGKTVGVIKELHGEGFEPGVLQQFDLALASLSNMGAKIVEVTLPSLKYALGAYYIVQPSEASSNLERFDGVRYGLRAVPTDKEVTAETMMAETRGQGFGWETKRRILLGTYALSAGYYDAYYGSALKVRTLLINEFQSAFSNCDVLVSPTAPTTAFKLGEELGDPLTMYMNDIATLPINLAGVPAISIPVGQSQGLPVGFQIIGWQKHDAKVFEVASALETGMLQSLDQKSEIRNQKSDNNEYQGVGASGSYTDNNNNLPSDICHLSSQSGASHGRTLRL